MTYRDYFEQHPDENIGWCKCYADKTECYYLVMYDGEPLWIKTPEGTECVAPRHCEPPQLKDFAFRVNNGYRYYHGWTDEQIALDAMHEIGCASCPFRDECDPMFEEIEEDE